MKLPFNLTITFTTVLILQTFKLTTAFLYPTVGKWLNIDYDDGDAQTAGTPLAQDPSNTEILQLIFLGFAQDTDVELSADITPCLNEDFAMTTAQFFYSVINKLANSDFLSVPGRIKEYEAIIDPSTIDCWNQNQEVQSVLSEYNINNASLTEIYSRFAPYIRSGNITALSEKAADIRLAYEETRYTDTGVALGQLIRLVVNFGGDLEDSHGQLHALDNESPLSKVAIFVDTQELFGFNDYNDDDYDENEEAQHDLRDLASGFFEEAGVSSERADSFIEKCFGLKPSRSTVRFIGDIFNQVLGKDYTSISSTIKDYKENLPADTLDCVASNSDLSKVMKNYGLEGKNLEYVYVKTVAYVISQGENALLKGVNKVKHEIESDAFEPAGEYAGKLLRSIASD